MHAKTQLLLCLTITLAVSGFMILGGCPSDSTTPTDLTDLVDDLGGGDQTSGDDVGVGANGGTTDGSTDDGSTTDDSTDDSSTDDSSTDDSDNTDVPAGYSSATIIHRGAGGFLVDTTADIPSGAGFNESSSNIKSEVRLARLSSDGSTIWFSMGDGNGFITPQLFCMNSDGTGLTEIDLPSGLVELPAEIWPASNGDTCAVLIHADGDGFAWSKSVFLLASRTSGSTSTIFDARNMAEENDFVNLQMSGDGLTIYFMGYDDGIIYSQSVSGGTPTVFATPSAFTRSGSIDDIPLKFRINCDASAMAVVVRFEYSDNTWPQDLYLIDNLGVTTLTNTGDVQARNDFNWTDLGVSNDGNYVAYVRRASSSDPWTVQLLDRSASQTRTMSSVSVTSLQYQTLLDCGGSLLFGSYGLDNPGGDPEQGPAIYAPDGSSALQFHDVWAHADARPVDFTSVSNSGTVFVGLWDTNSFGDKDRLYIWYPGTTSFDGGPEIDSVAYSLDNAAGTLTVRATVSDPVTSVRLLGFSDEFESLYQLPEDEDPFFTERFGKEMSATETDGVYELTVTFDGLQLDSSFRVRIGAGDDTSKRFAYVDFRPVPASNDTYDPDGDGQ